MNIKLRSFVIGLAGFAAGGLSVLGALNLPAGAASNTPSPAAAGRSSGRFWTRR
jgi:hypothetical protein